MVKKTLWWVALSTLAAATRTTTQKPNRPQAMVCGSAYDPTDPTSTKCMDVCYQYCALERQPTKMSKCLSKHGAHTCVVETRMSFSTPAKICGNSDMLSKPSIIILPRDQTWRSYWTGLYLTLNYTGYCEEKVGTVNMHILDSPADVKDRCDSDLLASLFDLGTNEGIINANGTAREEKPYQMRYQVPYFTYWESNQIVINATSLLPTITYGNLNVIFAWLSNGKCGDVHLDLKGADLIALSDHWGYLKVKTFSVPHNLRKPALPWYKRFF